MRCTRCDRPAIPQAVGRDPGGRLVFGWCLACMAEADCVGVVQVDRFPWSLRRRRTVLRLEPDPRPCEPRAAALRMLATVLGGWSLLFVAVALGRAFAGAVVPDSGLGAGSRPLLGVGGLALGATSLALYLAQLPPGPRIRAALRFIQAGGLALGLAALAVGILWHDPRRDPWIAGLAIGSIAAAALAGRRARGRVRPPRRARTLEPL